MKIKQEIHSHYLAKGKKNYLIAILSIILIALIIFSFVLIVFKYTVNAPNFDDFAYLEYTLRLINSQGFVTFLNELLTKHNGHGVLTAKFIFWVNYLIENDINFRHLIISSTVLVIFIFAFFVWLLRKNALHILYTLPIALLLFNPLYYENIMWAAATWQYTASIACCLTMFFLLSQPKNWAFVVALMFGFLTTYTNGNGIIGFFLGLVVLLPQKNYKLAAIWLTAVILTGIFYYTHSTPGFGSEEGRKVAPFFITLISFMAAAAYYLRLNINDLIVAGAFTSLVFALIIIRSGLRISFSLFPNSKDKVLSQLESNPANLTLLALIAWLFLTGMGVAWTRGILAFNVIQRYMIYSVLNLAVLYSFFLVFSSRRYRRFILLAGIGASVILQFCAHLYIMPTIVNFRNSFCADVYNLKNHIHLSGKVEIMTNKFVKREFDKALKKRIYHFPQIPIPDSNEELLKIQNPVIDSITKFTFREDTLDSYSGIPITSIINDKITLDESHPDNSIFVALKDEKTNKIHLMPANPTPNLNFRQFLKDGNHFNPGFEAQVYQGNVAPGKYTIGWLALQNKSVSLTFTNQEVQIMKTK